MKIQVIKKDDVHKQLEVTYDQKKWKTLQDKHFRLLKQKLEAPGFRKGKVPDSIAKEKIDKNKVLMNSFNEARTNVIKEINKDPKTKNQMILTWYLKY